MDEITSFLLSIIESSSDAIVGLSRDGSVISWNSGAEQIYGYASGEMVGQSISRLALPDHEDELPSILSRVLDGQKVRHYQTIHLKKGGIPIPVSLSLAPVYDPFDRIAGASFIARDLSRRFTFEKTIRETNQRYRKLKSSLELAHQIQELLLPADEELPGELDVFARTVYSEEVGGDYYDLFRTLTSTDQYVLCAVGDVSGHGTGAALLMALAKGMLQAEVAHTPFDLAGMMSRLNRFFGRYAETGRLMTLFLALFDVRTRYLSWTSAGQGPIYLYHPSEQNFEELPCTGPPLGVLEIADFESRSLVLKDGDILILGTDGLWEARNPEGEMFSVERVRQMLATWHHKGAEEICNRLLARVRKFAARTEPEDDTTLMIIKVPVRPKLP